jgi:MFS family permease
MATILSDRAVIYSGVIIQGAVAAIFSAYTGIFVASYHYDLNLPQYGALFIPQVVAAVVAALFAIPIGCRCRAERAYGMGLGCSLAGMVLLVATEWAKRQVFSYPLLLAASALVGAGLGLSFTFVRSYAVSLKPLRARRQVLLVNGLVTAGLVAAPVYALLTRATSIWWSLPVVLGILLIAEMLLSRSLSTPLEGPRARRENRRVPVRFRLYPALALLYGLCAVACLTAPHYLTGPVPSARHLHFRVLVEVAFWAALVQGSRVAFAIIDNMKSRQLAASIGVFMIAIVVFVLSVTVSRYDLMHTGLYLLAAVGCAALLPIDTRPGHEHLAVYPAAVAAGLWALFPAGVGLSRLGYDIVIGSGVSSLAVFLSIALVGVAACILLLPIILKWHTMAYFEQPASRHFMPPGAGQSGAAAMPGPLAAPRPRRPRDRPEDDSEGREPGGATALPDGQQRGSRREGR